VVEDIYEKNSLVDALKLQIKLKGLNLRRVCLSCDINASYFSRVLKDDANLSSSQLFRILKFLNVDSDEFDYVFLLWHLSQAQEKSERDHFLKKVRDIQNEKTKVSARIESKVMKSAEQVQKDIQSYYSEVVTALIHMLLTMDKYSKQPHLIAGVLGISERKLNLELLKLTQLNLVEQRKDSMRVNDESIHLPAESPLSYQNHINWRVEAIKDLTLQDSKFSDYHFSGAFTCDEDTKNKIKKLLKEVIVDSQKIVRDSHPSTLSRLLIDLF
jgi:transcriptional regulator with XRE-family HTH domain